MNLEQTEKAPPQYCIKPASKMFTMNYLDLAAFLKFLKLLKLIKIYRLPCQFGFALPS